MLIIFKWIGFIFVCLDTIAYIINTLVKITNVSTLLAYIFGIAMRVFTLYGTATYWLLK